MNADLPIVALTPGDPAGIGPDLVVTVARQPLDARMVVVADAGMLARRAERLGLPLEILDAGEDPPAHRPGQLVVHHLPLNRPEVCGRLDPGNAAYVIRCLDEAVDGCLGSRWQAMVTGPVNKAAINDGGIPFSGHTEFLADLGERLVAALVAHG